MTNYCNDRRKPQLFASCKMTKGIKRSVLIDLNRDEYYLIPNSLVELVEKFDNNSIKEIYALYDPSTYDILNQYFDFLIKKEMIFFPHNSLNFPNINFTEWKTPALIYNAIIDFDPFSNYNYKKAIRELAETGCKYVQIRFFSDCDYNFIKSVLMEIHKSKINFVELYIKYNNEESFNKLILELKKHEKVNAIYIYSSPFNKTIQKMSNTGLFDFFYIKDEINITSCGIVSKEYFVTNIKHYTKSLNVNSCLHGKIGIDKTGEIKNCPSCKTSFGNINNNKILDVIENKNYKNITNITKNEIKTCKVCEFRHICTDCRAYLDVPNDNYSKPLKCGYDPFKSEWQDWTQINDKISTFEYYKTNSI